MIYVFFWSHKLSIRYGPRYVATALLELVERSARGRSAPTVELNVHRENESARGFYEHVGFAKTGELCSGTVLVMQRKR